MTCVPDTVLRKFDTILFAKANVRNRNDLENYVRANCPHVSLTGVRVNGHYVTKQQEQECREALKDFKANEDGQWVSTFYPLFIFLVAQSGCGIRHIWHNSMPGRTNNAAVIETCYHPSLLFSSFRAPAMIVFRSNYRHMY